MAVSPLAPESLPRSDRVLGSGHGTEALGPSDSSDSGSDVAGASDAGLSMGDADLDSDTDRFGTGERAAAAGQPEVVDGADIAPDQVVSMPDSPVVEDEEEMD